MGDYGQRDEDASTRENHLLRRARHGDADAIDALLSPLRVQLLRFVELRLDRPLRARLDASDIVQESFIEAQRRLADFDDRRPMPFRIWLLKLTAERLAKARVKHLVRQRRAAGREVPLPERSSMALAAQLAHHSTPSEHAIRIERKKAVAEQVSRLKESQREILMLRHVDGLNYEEIGLMLAINAATARQRYVRALMRLRTLCVAAGLTSGAE